MLLSKIGTVKCFTSFTLYGYQLNRTGLKQWTVLILKTLNNFARWRLTGYFFLLNITQ